MEQESELFYSADIKYVATGKAILTQVTDRQSYQSEKDKQENCFGLF